MIPARQRHGHVYQPGGSAGFLEHGEIMG